MSAIGPLNKIRYSNVLDALKITHVTYNYLTIMSLQMFYIYRAHKQIWRCLYAKG